MLLETLHAETALKYSFGKKDGDHLVAKICTKLTSFYPIVVFRDGVGDGQLEVTKTHECEQFLAVFSKKNNGRGNNTTEVSKMESK